LFPGRRFGGGALAIYLHGEPVVDVWTGYADRRGTEYWTADTAAMVWSVSKPWPRRSSIGWPTAV